MTKTVYFKDLSGVQKVAYIYGYLESVIWSIIIGVAAFGVLSLIFGGGTELTDGETKLGRFFGGVFSILFLSGVVASGFLHVIFGVVLSKGIIKQSNKLVVVYLLFGLLSNAVRLGVFTFKIIVDFHKEPALGIDIGVIVYSVLYCGILVMVFLCHRQIRSHPVNQ